MHRHFFVTAPIFFDRFTMYSKKELHDFTATKQQLHILTIFLYASYIFSVAVVVEVEVVVDVGDGGVVDVEVEVVIVVVSVVVVVVVVCVVVVSGRCLGMLASAVPGSAMHRLCVHVRGGHRPHGDGALGLRCGHSPRQSVGGGSAPTAGLCASAPSRRFSLHCPCTRPFSPAAHTSAACRFLQ